MQAIQDIRFQEETEVAQQARLVDDMVLMCDVELSSTLTNAKKGKGRISTSPLIALLRRIQDGLSSDISIHRHLKNEFIKHPVDKLAKTLSQTVAAFVDLRLNGRVVSFRDFYVSGIFAGAYTDKDFSTIIEPILLTRQAIKRADVVQIKAKGKTVLTVEKIKDFMSKHQAQSAILDTDKGFVVVAMQNENFVIIDNQNAKNNGSLLPDFTGDIKSAKINFQGA